MMDFPKEPSDEMLRRILSVEHPATFRKELRSPWNGPESSKWTEKRIAVATKIYKAILKGLEERV